MESITISNPQDVQTIKKKIDSGEEVKIEDLSDTFREDLINALEKGNPSMSKEQVNGVYKSFIQSDGAQYLDLDTGETTSGIQANESYKKAISSSPLIKPRRGKRKTLIYKSSPENRQLICIY